MTIFDGVFLCGGGGGRRRGVREGSFFRLDALLVSRFVECSVRKRLGGGWNVSCCTAKVGLVGESHVTQKVGPTFLGLSECRSERWRLQSSCDRLPELMHSSHRLFEWRHWPLMEWDQLFKSLRMKYFDHNRERSLALYRVRREIFPRPEASVNAEEEKFPVTPCTYRW